MVVISHRFSGEYLPYLEAYLKTMNNVVFHFQRNKILFHGLSNDRVKALSFTIPSRGKPLDAVFQVEGWMQEYDDLMNLVKDLYLAHADNGEIVFEVNYDRDSDKVNYLKVVGFGEYEVSFEFSGVYSGGDLFTMPKLNFTSYIKLDESELNKLLRIFKTLKRYDSIAFSKPKRKPFKIVGKPQYGENKMEIVPKFNGSAKIKTGGSIYPNDLVKDLEYLIKRLKPSEVELRWGDMIPLKATIQTEKTKLIYLVAPKSED